MRTLTQTLVAVLVVVALSAAPASAQDDDMGHSPIVWVGAVATNLFYMPVKAVHGAFGGLVGGMAYLVSGLNPEVSGAVFDHTIFASWYVTPAMLEGREELYFFGGEG